MLFSLSLFLSFSLTGEEDGHTLFTGQRERERERERDKGGGREDKRVACKTSLSLSL
jgi:hypothetical protein